MSISMEGNSRFLKVLKASDLDRLVVTKPLLELMPPLNPNRGDISVRVFDNQTGRIYEFNLSIRAEGYPKPVLSGGWKAFIRDRGVAVGDKLYFWVEDHPAHATEYRIALEKPNLFPPN